MGSGLCHPCPKIQWTLLVTGAEETCKTMPWLLKLLPENDTHPFQLHFIDQSMSHGHISHKEAGEVPTPPHVPGRRSAGQCLVTSTDHYPKLSQLTCRSDGHAQVSCQIFSGLDHQPLLPTSPGACGSPSTWCTHNLPSPFFLFSAFPTLPTQK